jgi:hypothetical protein
MGWGALLGEAVDWYQKNQATNNAADATNKGNNDAIAEQRYEFDKTQKNMQPFLDFGTWAIPKQQAYLNGDMSGFLNSADYLGALKGQTMASDRSAASRGALGSGGHLGDLYELGSRIANQYGNSYYDKLTGASNTGYNSANALGNYGSQAARNIGGLLEDNGANRASSYLQNANNLSGLLGAGVNAYQNWYGNRQYSQPSTSPSTNWASGFGNNTGWLYDGSYGGGGV